MIYLQSKYQQEILDGWIWLWVNKVSRHIQNTWLAKFRLYEYVVLSFFETCWINDIVFWICLFCWSHVLLHSHIQKRQYNQYCWQIIGEIINTWWHYLLLHLPCCIRLDNFGYLHRYYQVRYIKLVQQKGTLVNNEFVHWRRTDRSCKG
jgi:hypothetical protein